MSLPGQFCVCGLHFCNAYFGSKHAFYTFTHRVVHHPYCKILILASSNRQKEINWIFHYFLEDTRTWPCKVHHLNLTPFFIKLAFSFVVNANKFGYMSLLLAAPTLYSYLKIVRFLLDGGYNKPQFYVFLCLFYFMSTLFSEMRMWW